MAKKSKRRVSEEKKAGKTTNVTAGVALLSGQVGHILVIVILGVLVYSNTFNVPFALDDVTNIINNPLIKDLHRVFDLHNIYDNRFIGNLTFALNYRLHELDVVGYHLFNLLVHLLNALLVYWLVILTLKTPFSSIGHNGDASRSSDSRRWIPLFTALLFVSHPVQTQAVTYIVQRFASLSTLFYLLSLVMYIKARGSETSKMTKYALFAVSVISAVLAMRTKEIAFTLPIIVMIYEFIFFPGSAKKRLRSLFPLLLLMLTLLIVPLSIMLTQSGSNLARGIDELTKIAGSADVSRWDYLNTQFRVIVTYIRLLFLPVGQNLDYDYPIYRTFFTPPVFLSFLFLLAVFSWGVYLLYRSYKANQRAPFEYKMIAFGIFWFFVTLSVESSIIPIADVIFEHRLYLPSIGFSMAFMTGVGILYVNPPIRMKGMAKALMPLMILIVIGLSLTTYARNRIWSDMVTLWSDVVAKSPHQYRPHNNLGMAYWLQGRLDDAIREYGIAIRLRPDLGELHYNLADAYRQQGRLYDAVREYRTALSLNREMPEARYGLGLVYRAQGLLDNAIREYQAAIALRPDYADAHTNLGVAYHNQGRLEDAIREYQMAISSEPGHAMAHFNLGVAYQNQGRFDDAIKEYETVITLRPDHADARRYLTMLHQERASLDNASRNRGRR
ncbi:MAG: tetratricopeptide repeat protein [Syntrophales bacterium]